MKITVIDNDYTEWHYQGDQLFPLVDDVNGMLTILDTEGRSHGGFHQSSWHSFHVDRDGLDDMEGQEGSAEDDADEADNPECKKVVLVPLLMSNPDFRENRAWAERHRSAIPHEVATWLEEAEEAVAKAKAEVSVALKIVLPDQSSLSAQELRDMLESIGHHEHVHVAVYGMPEDTEDK